MQRLIIALLLVCGGGCGFSIVGLPGKFHKSDLCGDSDSCDVQGGVPVSLLNRNSSRLVISDPLDLLGWAFDTDDEFALYKNPLDCGGRLDASAVDAPVHVQTQITRRPTRAGFTATLERNLESSLNSEGAQNAQAAVKMSVEQKISLVRSVYTIKRGASRRTRAAQCRAALCGQDPQKCKAGSHFAVITSVAVISLDADTVVNNLTRWVPLSGDSVKTVHETVRNTGFVAFVAWDEYL